MGKVVFFNLPGTRPSHLADFYCHVFGWTKAAFPGLENIWVLFSGAFDQPGINGLIMSRQYLDYVVNEIEVEDLDAALLKVTELGGSVITPKQQMPGLGNYAWCTDLDGNQIILIQKAEEYLKTVNKMAVNGIPDNGITNRPIHFEIPGRDSEKLAAFYEQALGWKTQKWDGPIDYIFAMGGAEDEAGIDGAFIKKGFNQHPVNTISVADIDDITARILANGGSVKTPKHMVPGVGLFSYCLDPDKNQFGIMQFIKSNA